MVAFTDSQLRAVWAAADRLPFEKRGVFIERVVARLQLQRGYATSVHPAEARGIAANIAKLPELLSKR